MLLRKAEALLRDRQRPNVFTRGRENRVTNRWQNRRLGWFAYCDIFTSEPIRRRFAFKEIKIHSIAARQDRPRQQIVFCHRLTSFPHPIRLPLLHQRMR